MNKINRMISKYNFNSGSISRVRYIVVHYVGALGGAKENCAYYGGGSRGASAHYFVGFAGEIWQCVEDKDIAWHCGAGSYRHPECRNANSIGIEMCVRKKSTETMNATDKDWYFEKATVQSAAELTRYLMKKYTVQAERVIRHYDVTGKICPNPYVYNTGTYTWDAFKKAISGQNTQPQTTGTQASAFSGLSEKQAAEKLLGICAPIAKKNGLLPSVATAQCILESGYCRTELAQKANNICGMKCSLSGNTWSGTAWDGKSSVKIRTAEQDAAGNTYYINADFRKYPCMEKSIADRCAYLLGAVNGSKKRYAGITKCKTYREQITLIKNGGYATDVNYIQKICNIIKKYGLDRQDGAGDILPDTTEIWYRVRKSWSNAKSQIGAFHNMTKAKQCADQHAGYSVFDENGKKLYTSAKVPYKIRVTKTNVPIRTGPAKKYSKARVCCPVGVYEIVEEKNGFGRLKSGAGWVYLKKVVRV